MGRIRRKAAARTFRATRRPSQTSAASQVTGICGICGDEFDYAFEMAMKATVDGHPFMLSGGGVVVSSGPFASIRCPNCEEKPG